MRASCFKNTIRLKETIPNSQLSCCQQPYITAVTVKLRKNVKHNSSASVSALFAYMSSSCSSIRATHIYTAEMVSYLMLCQCLKSHLDPRIVGSEVTVNVTQYTLSISF